VEFPIRISFVTSQDYQNCWSHTKEGNLSGPVVRATTHTLTPTTLTNSSHNSRVPCVHPSSRDTTRGMPFRATTQEMSRAQPLSRATTQGIRSEPQLKGTQASRPLRYHWSIVDHAHPHHTSNYFDHGPRIYNATTNLPARDPASTNLLAHSPTLRTSRP